MATASIRLRVTALAPMHRLALDAGTGTSWLTDEEAARLAAMGSAHRQAQFLAGHWLVRVLAARHLGGEPTHWRWSRPDGEPASLHREGERVFASLSHSGEWLAAAVGDETIGLDVEAAPKPRDFLALAGQVFSPEECAWLRDAPDELGPAFHRFWTIKEATGKRDGRGLRMEVARRQVPIVVGTDAPFDVLPAKAGMTGEVETWQEGDIVLALAHSGDAIVDAEGLPAGASHARWRIRVLD